MSVLAKKEGLLRAIGSLIIFIGLFLSIISDFFLLDNFIYYLFLIILIIPIIIFVICAKLEWDIIRNYPKIALAFLSCYVLLMIIIGILTKPYNEFLQQFSIIIISNILLITCWHFSLSIYKKEKIIFLISGLGFIITSFFFKVGLIITQMGLIISFLPLILIIFGMSLILVIETKMKKKELLNYI